MDPASDLVRAAQDALKAGQREAAAEMLRALLTADPELVPAWALLAQATDDRAETLYALGSVLALTDDAEVRAWAQRHLARLEDRAVPQPHRAQPAEDRRLLLLAALVLSVILLLAVALFIGTELQRASFAPTQQAAEASLSPSSSPTLAPLPTRTDAPSLTPFSSPTPRATHTAAATRTPSPSPTASLTPGPPAPFEAIQPAEGGVTRRADPLLAWQLSAGAEHYQLWVEAPDGMIIEQRIEASNCTEEGCEVAISGTINGPYRWQVSAQNALGAISIGPATFVRSYIPPGPLELGGQVPNSLAHHELMRSAGMTWVKFQVNWPANSIEEVASFVQAGRAQGFRVLLSVTGPFQPSSIDAGGYVSYVAQVAALRPDAIEVWNEPNIDSEWPAGQIDPAAYVRDILAPSYRAIKESSPDTMVISAGLASSGVHNLSTVWSDDNYIRGMANAGATRYADCMGFHHNSMATSPSARSGHPADDGRNHYSWYFLPTADLNWRGFNGARPLCLTEIGALSGEGLGALPDAWNWASGTSVDEQAAWLAEAVDLAQANGHIRLMIIWNVDYSRFDRDPQAGFAILRPDGGCPACDLLRIAIGS